MVDSSVLQKEVSKLLSGADLNAITTRKVRAELEQTLGVDLSQRKAEIEAAIQAALKAAASAGGADNSEEDNKSGDNTDSSLSELEDDSRPAAKGKTAKTKPSKQQPNKLSDEELARQLHAKENGLPRRRAAAAAASSAAGSSSGTAGKKRKSGGGGGGFSKPCALSPALASVLGCDSMPRQQVVKRLWDMAKERNLFDPKNKQFVLCDAEFEKLFGKKRLRMFALMKYLKNHVKNVDG